MGSDVKYTSTLLAQNNDPTEIQKADLDLLKKINELEALVSAVGVSGVTPIGGMVPFAGASDKIPASWMLCDGSAVSRAKYAALFAVIGTTWGAGDGSKTFNLPDLVGATPAGAGTSTGYMQNETIPFAEKVDDQTQGHRHPPLNGSFYTNASGTVADIANGALRYTQATTGNPVTDGTNGTPRTGPTTHGKLVGVNFIIRVL